MRRQFFLDLYELMKADERIYALTGDLGFGGFNRIRDEMPERFINCMAAEQLLLGASAGLALSGKIVFAYSITPFLIWGSAEFIRLYINHEKIPVILIGSGRDDDYKHDGWSHDATDIPDMMKQFENIMSYYPETKDEIRPLLESIIKDPKPSFISLKR